MKWLIAFAVICSQPIWAASYNCANQVSPTRVDSTLVETLPVSVKLSFLDCPAQGGECLSGEETIADTSGVCGSPYPISRCLVMESNVDGFPELEVNCYSQFVLLFSVDGGQGTLSCHENGVQTRSWNLGACSSH